MHLKNENNKKKTMNRINQLFERKQKNILNIYCTAGYPKLESTTEVILSLDKAGADLVEIGMPYVEIIISLAQHQQLIII